MRYIAMIPCKSVSKGVPGKNMKHLAGMPLVHYTITAAIGSMRLDEVLVNTDDELIARYAEDHMCNSYVRPKELISDTTSMTEVVFDFDKNYKRDYDALVLLQPTSPFRNCFHIDMAIRAHDMSEKDCLVSVYSDYEKNVWGTNLDKRSYFHPDRKNQRQQKAILKIENGAIYITSRKFLREKGLITSQDPLFYFMDKKSSLEIDSHEDWSICEKLVG